jgi:hypothetical protein
LRDERYAAARGSTLALDRVDAFFQVPDRIHNIPLWEENCRKIHARAADFISGRTSLMEAASEISRLAAWTQAEDDPAIQTLQHLGAHSTQASDCPLVPSDNSGPRKL